MLRETQRVPQAPQDADRQRAPRSSWWARAVGWTAAASLAVVLAACGGSDDDDDTTGGGGPPVTTVQITGLAAVGAAIPNATVTGTNAAGQTATATTGPDGSYTLDIPEGAPYALQVTDAGGNTWYSYAPAAGRANLTPLTTLALSQAWGHKPLADLVSAWQANAPTAEQVLQAAAKVNANLASVMQARGVDPSSTNIFTQVFSANGQGLDAVLDAIRVSFSCSAGSCTQTINSPDGQVLVTWNANISTVGFTLSWTDSTGGGGGQIDVNLGSCTANPVAGTYSMVVETTVAGLGGIPIPTICVDGLPDKPASQADFCGAGDVTTALPPGVAITACTYDGTVGSITAQITSPILLEYTVKYTFVRR